MKRIKLIYCLCLFIISSPSFAQTKTIPYQELATATGSLSGSGIFFGASMTTSSITVTFEGPSDRWIAMGFGSSMPSTDALIYSNGTTSSIHTLDWYDYYISSYNTSGVTQDVTQNWNVISNLVSGSQRTVVATRTLSTGDSNDAVINFTSTALSLVWAKGSSANYTIAYHGSSNRANGISLTWLSPPTASFVTNSTTVCAGSSITYSNISTGGLTTYTWSFGGASPATSTSTNPVVTYTAPGTYSVALTASNAIGVNTFTQVNYITVTPTIVPSLSISQISGSNPICSGASAGFSVIPVNGGSAPNYQWKVNGANVGTNSSNFTSASLSNNSSVTCVMISNAVCPSPATVSSSAITMTVNSSAPASVSVSISAGGNPICAGSSVTFSANSINGGSAPFYQWKINGSNVGTNSAIFTTNSFANGDIVTCELSSNNVCASSTFAISSGITMTVSSNLSPSLSINIITGPNPLCAGDTLVFGLIPINGGSAPTYNWKINGLAVGNTSASYSTNALTNGQVVSCEMISSLSCSSPTFAISSGITLTVNAIPSSPSIIPSGTIGICNGASLTLVSSSSTGNIWSTNANTQSISVTAIGNYFVSQTVNGCISAPSAIVTVTSNPQPVVTISSVGPFCVNENTTTLQGLPSGGVFSGNGVVANAFNPSLATIGNNTIQYSYTDTNNCTETASTTISVSECVSLKSIAEDYLGTQIYPNPSKDVFYINSLDKVINSIIISDATGKIIVSNYYKNEQSVDVSLSLYPQGVYFLKLFKGQFTENYLLIKID